MSVEDSAGGFLGVGGRGRRAASAGCQNVQDAEIDSSSVAASSAKPHVTQRSLWAASVPCRQFKTFQDDPSIPVLGSEGKQNKTGSQTILGEGQESEKLMPMLSSNEKEERT